MYGRKGRRDERNPRVEDKGEGGKDEMGNEGDFRVILVLVM